MPYEAQSWRNVSPGDLSIELPEVQPTEVEPVLRAAANAMWTWARAPMEERFVLLRAAQKSVEEKKEELAIGISIETGKPITEARGEVGAVIAKFDLTIEDATAELVQREIVNGPHPAFVRRLARGPRPTPTGSTTSGHSGAGARHLRHQSGAPPASSGRDRSVSPGRT